MTRSALSRQSISISADAEHLASCRPSPSSSSPQPQEPLADGPCACPTKFSPICIASETNIPPRRWLSSFDKLPGLADAAHNGLLELRDRLPDAQRWTLDDFLPVLAVHRQAVEMLKETRTLSETQNRVLYLDLAKAFTGRYRARTPTSASTTEKRPPTAEGFVRRVLEEDSQEWRGLVEALSVLEAWLGVTLLQRERTIARVWVDQIVEALEEAAEALEEEAKKKKEDQKEE